MKLKILYPILFKATIKGQKPTRRDRFVSVTHVEEARVPSVSTKETEVVLDVLREGMSANRPQGVQFAQLRSYGGRVYRRLCGGAELFGLSLQGDPFSKEEFLSTEAKVGNGSSYPLAHPVWTRNAWLEHLLGITTLRNDKIWPSVNHNEALLDRHRRREAITFGAVAGQIDAIDAESYAHAMDMVSAQTNSLLSIGGELWMRATAPCVTVTPRSVNLGFLPLGVDTRTDWMRFPLSKFEDAVEYFQANFKPAKRGEPRPPVPWIDLGRQDFAPFDFDEQAEALYRLSFSLASAVVRRNEQQGFHDIYEGKGPLFEGRDAGTLDMIRGELLASNDIVGHRGDLPSLLDDIVDLWRKTDRPTYTPLIQGGSRKADEMLEKLIDAAPIGIDTVTQGLAPVFGNG